MVLHSWSNTALDLSYFSVIKHFYRFIDYITNVFPPFLLIVYTGPAGHRLIPEFKSRF